MADTYDLGPYFFHTIPLRDDAPRVHRAVTREIDDPFRTSNSLVVRIWGEHGLVFGRWRPSALGEDEALLAALGREMDEVTPDDMEDWLGPESADDPR